MQRLKQAVGDALCRRFPKENASTYILATSLDLRFRTLDDHLQTPEEYRQSTEAFCSAVKVLYFINIFCNFQQFKGYLKFVGELQQTDHPGKFVSIVYCFIVESNLFQCDLIEERFFFILVWQDSGSIVR